MAMLAHTKGALDTTNKSVHNDFFDQENGAAPVKQVRRVQKYGLEGGAAEL